MSSFSCTNAIQNQSPYPLKDCIVYGLKVVSISEIQETKFETRELVWGDYRLGKRDIDKNGSVRVLVFGIKESNEFSESSWFVTQSSSPHRVSHGIYNIYLELKFNYLWKKVKYPIFMKIVFDKNLIEGELI